MYVSHLQVVGDSRVIIEWVKRKSNLQVLSLGWWQKRVRKLQEVFVDLHFQHIFREYNTLENKFSKDDFPLDERRLFFEEFKDSSLVSRGFLVVF